MKPGRGMKNWIKENSEYIKKVYEGEYYTQEITNFLHCNIYLSIDTRLYYFEVINEGDTIFISRHDTIKDALKSANRYKTDLIKGLAKSF